MRELVGSKNTIGQMASVLKNLQKATVTFTFYSQNKKSQLQSEQISILTVAKEQMTVVRTSLQTVGYTSVDVAAKFRNNRRRGKDNSSFIASYSLNCRGTWSGVVVKALRY